MTGGILPYFDQFGEQNKLTIMSIQPAHARARAGIPISLDELPWKDHRRVTG